MPDHLQRLAALTADGWKSPVQLLTDGINAAASEQTDLLRTFYTVTGNATIRLYNCHPQASQAILDRTKRDIELANECGATINLAVKPFTAKHTSGQSCEPGRIYDMVHERQLGYLVACLQNAKKLGVMPRYVLFDHADDMSEWDYSTSNSSDSLIAERWERVFRLVNDSMWACKMDLIVFGNPFGNVLPNGCETGWLAHHWYWPTRAECQSATRNLLIKSRDEYLAIYVDPRRKVGESYRLGRAMVDRDLDWPGCDRIDAWIIYPCVGSSPESVEGTIELLEGIKG